jgi:hypothetical protein
VQNTSTEEPVTITSLSDSVYGTLAGDADCQVGTVLAAGASCTFDFVRVVTVPLGDHTNWVTAKAVDNDNTEATDSDDATVMVYAQVKVWKTVNDLPFSGPELTFQLRQGASMTSLGETLETRYANVGNNGQVTFDELLLPGTYQLVELIPVGYVPSYVWGTYGVEWFRPGYEQGEGGMDPVIWVAVNFLVNADGTITFQPGSAQQIVQPGDWIDINNNVGQMPFTIGFWKNHSSESGSNGGQEPYLDRMLYEATQAGETIYIGTLALPGGSNPDDAGNSALWATRLLNKSTVNTNKKMASDPAWNLAAQLLCYRLNQRFDAWLNPVAGLAADIGQLMLENVNFNGQSYAKPSKATYAKWAANMNYLAMVLDSYNNGTLALTELNMPYPEVGYDEDQLLAGLGVFGLPLLVAPVFFLRRRRKSSAA